MYKKVLERQLKQAMEKGEMKEFLLGELDYGIRYREYYETEESIRIHGIYHYYEKDPNVKPVFEQGLLDLVNGSAYEILKAYEYLSVQVVRESGIGAEPPFELDKDVYIKLRRSILSKKEELQNIKSVDRDDVPVKSAYQYMEDINNDYKSNFGIRIY